VGIFISNLMRSGQLNAQGRFYDNELLIFQEHIWNCDCSLYRPYVSIKGGWGIVLWQVRYDLPLQHRGCAVSDCPSACHAGAAVAGIYRVAGKNMAPLEALVWGVGQTVLTLIISFSRILATLWGFWGNVWIHTRTQMYRFPENGIVNKWKWHCTRVWMDSASQNPRKKLSCLESLPSGVHWLHYCTAPYVPPSQARCTRSYVKLQEKAPCLAAIQVNIGVEIIILNSVVLSYRDVLRNWHMCQTLFFLLTLIMWQFAV
jgi:hypothetical protein